MCAGANIPDKQRKDLPMNKLISLCAAAIAALTVGLGFAATGNAQTPGSPMTDQAYCHLLADKYTGGFKYGRSEVGNATAVAIAQCLEGNARPAIPVLVHKLHEADIPVPARS
jgi:hypothetical protein